MTTFKRFPSVGTEIVTASAGRIFPNSNASAISARRFAWPAVERI